MNTEAQTQQPNQLEVAKNQMKKFLEHINVPESIKTNESHLMHVVIVEGRFNQQTLETVYSSKVQTFDSNSWNVVEKRLKQLGYSHVFLIHDPRVETPKAENKTPEAQKVDRAKLIEKAESLGYDGAKNVANQVFIDFIAQKEERAMSGTTKKVLTQEDLDANPELVEQGLAVGDEIEIQTEE